MSGLARAAIRWAYHGSAIVLLAARTGVILLWPMDGLHPRMRAEIAARTRSS